MPLNTLIVASHAQRVVHLHNGRFVGCLGPGRHVVWTLSGNHEFIRLEVGFPLKPVVDPDLVPADLEGSHLITVAQHERVALSLHGTFRQLLGPGRYRWWELLGEPELVRFDLREEPIPLANEDLLPQGSPCVEHTASAAQAVVLLQDGQPVRALAPGRYRAWALSPWSLRVVPLALQTLDVAAQDLLSRDQVPIRVKPAVAWRVVDPMRHVVEPDHVNQCYTAVQMALRDVVTARDLEVLLSDREALGRELLERARAHLPDLGIALETVVLKDLILPGEVKDLFNRVTLARKEAEAMSIRRREETAQTRQLANTAKLLENNPVLLRLKEIEGLSELASRIDKLTLVGGAELVRPALLAEVAKGE